MGQSASCAGGDMEEFEFVRAIREGNLERLEAFLDENPNLCSTRTGALSTKHNLCALHYAASQGQAQVLAYLLERDSMANPNALNHHKQTPLMLACKHGRLACIERLIESGADVLMFDSPRKRTCLHYAAKSGHHACLQRILDAGQLPPVVETWGFARFVNVRDGSGSTPLHLAARFSHSAVVHLLLANGAIVCATITAGSTRGNRSYLRSTPLHMAARGGSTECVRELLAWGADRNLQDARGHTPYYIAIKYGYIACAALLNPRFAEPLVWPSPWKFMSNLDPQAKKLLEAALAQANNGREKCFLASVGSGCATSCSKDYGKNTPKAESAEEEEDFGAEVCCICFENPCTIEIQNCSHKMCASCTLALFSHNKPNPAIPLSLPPACPFCRRNIVQLKCATTFKEHSVEREERGERSLAANTVKKIEESGSSGSFKGLVSKGSSFRLLSSRGSGRVVDNIRLKESSSQELCVAI